MILKIGDDLAGLTIKKVLFDRLSFSRGAVTALKKKEHGIEVNSEHKTVRYVLCKGDELSLMLEDESPSEKIRASSGEVAILYEDDFLIALNKPPHLAVHPSKKIQDDTLAGRLLSIRPNLVFRAMGRLDKNTSGAVVVSKTKVVSAKLFLLVSKRKVDKKYLLITNGVPKEKKGTVKSGIVREEESYIKRVCTPFDDASESEKAVTEYEVIAETDKNALVLASPVTGRTHQLRAHFAFLGCPILGDDLYGEKSEIIKRQALHALSLSFIHPETGKDFTVKAPLFPDMENAINSLFGDGEKLVQRLKALYKE